MQTLDIDLKAVTTGESELPCEMRMGAVFGGRDLRASFRLCECALTSCSIRLCTACQLALPHLLKHDWSAIINLGSDSGTEWAGGLPCTHAHTPDNAPQYQQITNACLHALARCCGQGGGGRVLACALRSYGPVLSADKL